MTIAYLGLGGNLGHRRWHLEEAIRRLEASGALRVVQRSSIYETAPVGREDQPPFLNLVVAVATDLDPHALLALLQRVETGLGRVRGTGVEERWGPRTIDLDVLLYGDLGVATEALVIPHPEMHRRAFVLVPLLEIAPDLSHPVLGPLADLRHRLPSGQRVSRVGDPWAQVLGRLATRAMGRPLVPYGRVGSTNDVARDLAEAGAGEGTAVVAEEQTAGRGRQGRTWHSPPGGLWLSVILRPARPSPGVGLAVGVAAATALRRATGADVRLKWPNDLVIAGRKLGGILLEAAGGAVIAGIGINLNVDEAHLPPEVRASSISLAAHLGRPVDRAGVLADLLGDLEAEYAAWRHGGAAALLSSWRALSATLGRPVSVVLPEARVEGLAEDVDEEGALLVRQADGSLRRVVAGDLAAAGGERA
ncbi:MAG: biotin--[acetyl-CoA-carboxylase] ligase [Armatimonadetes bacterium]|nr:biotin--[acetyl-CoA-carboxylase] ligase [Armatimonadota bacterium]